MCSCRTSDNAGHIHNPLDVQARSKLLKNRPDNRLLNKSLTCHRDFRKKTVTFADVDFSITVACSLKSQKAPVHPKKQHYD